MKPTEIEVGKTYVNKGKGKTSRKVIYMGRHVVPPLWHGFPNARPEEPGVEFVDSRGRQSILYLSSFMRWVGREATEEEELE